MSARKSLEAHLSATAFVEEIYEAVFDPGQWSNVVTTAAEIIGGSSSLIYGLSPIADHESWFGHRFPAAAMQTYAEYYEASTSGLTKSIADRSPWVSLC